MLLIKRLHGMKQAFSARFSVYETLSKGAVSWEVS